MPIVPSSNQLGNLRVNPDGTPLQQDDSKHLDFGEAHAEEIGRTGKALQQGIRKGVQGAKKLDGKFKKFQDERDAVKVMDGVESGKSEMDDIIRNPETGLLTRKGMASEGVRDEAMKKLDETGNRIRDGLKPRARDAFTVHWGNYTTETLAEMGGFEEQEHETIKRAVGGKFVANALSNIGNLPAQAKEMGETVSVPDGETQEPVQVASLDLLFQNIMRQTENQVSAFIEDPDERAGLMIPFRSQAHTKVAETIGETDPAAAINYVEQNAEEMVPERRQGTIEFFKERQHQQTVQTLKDDALMEASLETIYVPNTEQQVEIKTQAIKKIKMQRENDEIDETQFDDTMKAIEDQTAATEFAGREEMYAADAQIRELQNSGGTFADAPREIQELVKHHGSYDRLMARGERMRSGKPVTTDRNVYRKLWTNMRDPKKREVMEEINLDEWGDKGIISDEDLSILKDMQAKLAGGENPRQVDLRGEIAEAKLRELGFGMRDLRGPDKESSIGMKDEHELDILDREMVDKYYEKYYDGIKILGSMKGNDPNDPAVMERAAKEALEEVRETRQFWEKEQSKHRVWKEDLKPIQQPPIFINGRRMPPEKVAPLARAFKEHGIIPDFSIIEDSLNTFYTDMKDVSELFDEELYPEAVMYFVEARKARGKWKRHDISSVRTSLSRK